MQISTTWLRWMTLCVCMGPLLGCAGEKSTSEDPESAAVTAADPAPEEKARPTKNAQTADAALRRATRLANRVERSNSEARGSLAPPRPIARRTPPPGGMDAFPDFKGTRIGLVHTANVIGEVDPCG